MGLFRLISCVGFRFVSEFHMYSCLRVFKDFAHIYGLL